MRFRVVCGRGVTMATFFPTSAFTSVDLPAFGRPMMATNPDLKLILFCFHSRRGKREVGYGVRDCASTACAIAPRCWLGARAAAELFAGWLPELRIANRRSQ